MPDILSEPGRPDPDTPWDQLPRGLVRYPQVVVDHVNSERAKFPPEIYTEEYAREALEFQTLVHYYEGIPVAYRPAPDGVEILAVGWEDVARFWREPVKGVIVRQT